MSLMSRRCAAASLGAALCAPKAAWAARQPSLEERLREVITLKPGYLKAPGASAAVITASGALYSATRGTAQPGQDVRVTAQTRFMSGSTGKTFCAATVMRLVEDGRLDLEAPISDYLAGQPRFAAIPNGAAMTAAHLLLHQGGFPQFLDIGAFQWAYLKDSVLGNSVAYSPQRMLSFAGAGDMLFKPGEGHHYSDLNYHLLGLLIEAITGQGYYEVLDRLVLSRMRQFRADILFADRKSLPGLAAGIAKGDLLGRIMGVNGVTLDDDGALRKSPVLEYTGGGLALTPRSLAQFYCDLANGHIVSSQTFEVMLKAAVRQPDAPGAPYGFGFYVSERPALGRYISHSGFYPGYTSNAGYFLDHGFAAAVQQSSDHGPDLFEKLRQIAQAVLATQNT